MKLLLLSLAFAAGAAAAHSPVNEESPIQSYEDMVAMAQTVYPQNKIIVSPMKTETESWRIQGDTVVLLPEEIQTFHEKGYIQLPPIFTKEELAEIRAEYDKFVDGTYPVPGRDFGDMSVPFDTPVEKFNMINVLLPRHYKPDFRFNLYERRAKSISDQLYNKSLALDYDQILAKKPGKKKGKFVWHQDMGYWPDPRDDEDRPTTTATVSLALNDAVVRNGCLVVVSGSGTGKRDSLRKHTPLMAAKDIERKTADDIEKVDGVAVAQNHALKVEIDNDDVITFLPVATGGLTVHDEWILHGSGGNQDLDKWRHTYVLAYRDPGMIEWERSLEPGGFRHSHNDKVQWDTFRQENVKDGIDEVQMKRRAEF